MNFSEQQLKQGIVSGGRTVIGYLYQKLGGKIIGYVLNNSGTKEDGNDCFRLALVKAKVKIEKQEYKDEGKLEAYLFGIARNDWLNELRKRKKRSIEKGDLSEREYAIADKQRSPEEQIIFNEMAQALHRCLSFLKKSCRTVLELFYFEEKRLVEIAAFLGEKDGTIRKRHHDCLGKLRLCMRGN